MNTESTGNSPFTTSKLSLLLILNAAHDEGKVVSHCFFHFKVNVIKAYKCDLDNVRTVLLCIKLRDCFIYFCIASVPEKNPLK